MDERDQLQAQWLALNTVQREDLFRAWILAATIGFQPANISLIDGSEVIYTIAPDASSWQVGVPTNIFTNASPDPALEVGDIVIEIGHLFVEFQEIIDELSEFEFEDESVEGAAAAILPIIIDELEELLEDRNLDSEQIKEIEDLIDEYKKELEELGISG